MITEHTLRSKSIPTHKNSSERREIVELIDGNKNTCENLSSIKSIKFCKSLDVGRIEYRKKDEEERKEKEKKEKEQQQQLIKKH